MGAEAVIISECLLLVIQTLALKAKAAGMTDEQISAILDKALEDVINTKPEDLPDV